MKPFTCIWQSSLSHHITNHHYAIRSLSLLITKLPMVTSEPHPRRIVMTSLPRINWNLDLGARALSLHFSRVWWNLVLHSFNENVPLLDNLHSVSPVVYRSTESHRSSKHHCTSAWLLFVIHPEHLLLVLTEEHKGDGNFLEWKQMAVLIVWEYRDHCRVTIPIIPQWTLKWLQAYRMWGIPFLLSSKMAEL